MQCRQQRIDAGGEIYPKTCERCGNGPCVLQQSDLAGAKGIEAINSALAQGVNNVPPVPRSAGQELLDRLLGQYNHLNDLRVRLLKVRCSIDGGKAPNPSDLSRSSPAMGQSQSFFGGLILIADSGDMIADEIEKTIADLEALF